jgi:hypothetical protein
MFMMCGFLSWWFQDLTLLHTPMPSLQIAALTIASVNTIAGDQIEIFMIRLGLAFAARITSRQNSLRACCAGALAQSSLAGKILKPNSGDHERKRSMCFCSALSRTRSEQPGGRISSTS